MSLQDPIIVKLINTPDDPIGGVADVLIAALGISGVMALGAALLGVLLGVLIFWVRSR